MFAGLIVGAIIRYASPFANVRTKILDLPPPPNSTFNTDLPPVRIILHLNVEDNQHSNESLFYEYRFKQQLKQFALKKGNIDEKVSNITVTG